MKPGDNFLGANGERLARIEWQRRQRSLFALIRAIIRRSSGEDVEDYKAHLNGRLDALTRLNTSAGTSERVDLALIVAEEMLANGATEGQDVIIQGPQVKLRADDAQTLGLAFHELATNAIKFGALAHGAQITVTWTSVDGVLRLEWREKSGAPQPHTAGQPGFGAEWIRQTLPYELDAVVDYTIDSTSVVCKMTIPLR